jgi:hypothetical protein
MVKEKVNQDLLNTVTNLIIEICKDNENNNIKSLRKYYTKYGLTCHYGTCLKKMDFIMIVNADYIVNPAYEIDLFSGELSHEDVALKLITYVQRYAAPKNIKEAKYPSTIKESYKKRKNLWEKFTYQFYSLFSSLSH